MPGYTRYGTYDDTKAFRHELDYNKQQYINNYNMRSQILDERYKPLSPKQFYRILFPSGWLEKKGEQKKGGVTAIMTVIPQTAVKYTPEEQVLLDEIGRTKAKAFNRLITDDLDEIGKYKGLSFFSLISPVSYYGRKHTAKNARWLHALTFDIDDVSKLNLTSLLHFTEKIHVLPKPTMIVNSGGGLHLYYVFSNPIPMLPQYKKALTDFKEALTRQLWTSWTSSNKNIQIHGITQGYRVVGTRTKIGYERVKEGEKEKRVEYRVKAWHTGTPVTLEYLNQFVSDKERIDLTNVKTSRISLEKAKEKYPEWYERVIVNGERGWGTWTCSKNLYNWWKREILSGVKVGNRYNCLRLLSAFALKCGVDAQTLWKDNQEIYRKFAEMTPPDHPNFLTKEEAAKAYHQFFHPEFIRVSIKTINKLTGFHIDKNRRNGRTQAEHMAIMRYIRDMHNPDWQNKDGAPTKKDIVVRWRLQNERGLRGTKTQCSEDTGLSFPTIRKWWDAAEAEGAQVPNAKQLPDESPKNIDHLSVEEKWAMIDQFMEAFTESERIKDSMAKAKTWEDVLQNALKETNYNNSKIYLRNAQKERADLFESYQLEYRKRHLQNYDMDTDLIDAIVRNASKWEDIMQFTERCPGSIAIRILQQAGNEQNTLLRQYNWKDGNYRLKDHINILRAISTMAHTGPMTPVAPRSSPKGKIPRTKK